MILYGLASLGPLLSPFTDGSGVDGQNDDFAHWFQAGSAASPGC